MKNARYTATASFLLAGAARWPRLGGGGAKVDELWVVLICRVFGFLLLVFGAVLFTLKTSNSLYLALMAIGIPVPLEINWLWVKTNGTTLG